MLRMMQERALNHLSVTNLWYTCNPWPCQHLGVKRLRNHDSITFRYSRESMESVISLVTTDQGLHIWQSHLPRKSVTSAQWKLVRKLHANIPNTPVNIANAFKYLQMLPSPPRAKHHAIRLCKSILRCSWSAWRYGARFGMLWYLTCRRVKLQDSSAGDLVLQSHSTSS
jgi:hypothetical protein